MVQAEALSVHYLGTGRWVLDAVTMEHLSGGVTAVVGPSGCGKTTLVRALCGLIPHSLPSQYAGSLRLAGTEMAQAGIDFLSEHVGYVGQSPDAAVVTRTVYDDVAFPLQNLCLEREEIDRRVREALALVGLSARAWDSPWRLSGGQRQRLALAVALAMRPELLILDEPTSTIDPDGRRDLYTLIAAVVGRGTGVVVIDHDLDPILPVVDQVLVLDAQGRTIALGPPREAFLTHRRELQEVGVWMPRALRGSESGRCPGQARPGAPDPQAQDAGATALTCQEAGITMPGLERFCESDQVAYYRRGPRGWERVPRLDTLAGRGPTPAPTDREGAAAPAGTTGPDGGAAPGQSPTAATATDRRAGPGTAEDQEEPAAAQSPEPGPALVDLEALEVEGRCPPVSMRLGGGELVAVVGPNGAGKSSLLSALAGLIPSRSARAAVRGRPVRRGRHEVGYVFQNPEHQFVTSSVSKELALGGTGAQRVERLMEQFHLAGHRDQHPMTLSGGQARRLSVATMVSEEREVIVLDEPTYGQDWACTRELMAFIAHLRSQGRTVIMATHDLELAMEHCSAIVALPHGHGPTTRTPGAEAARRTAPDPGPRPTGRRGLLTGLNPLTPLIALLPAMGLVLALKSTGVNLALLVATSVLIVGARAERRRTLAALIGPWALSALLVQLLSRTNAMASAERVIDLGSASATGTAIGALVGIALASGIATAPEALIRALTGTLRMPYRLGAAGTAAVAFITRFHEDLRLLRTARALRGVGRRWGPLAPLVRWAGSIVPLMILAIQHAERVSLSMDSRAFGAHRRRTEMVQEAWCLRDWLVVGLTWAVLAAVWRAVP
ncbi:ATP-binding cassette domain-containing protein [Actinomyces capricornis]|uniref:ATP-binding cassette domain-containing protein n=1 Tax=Actinomyces capricornis TaxID=2755559 RepID=UPI001CC7B9CC|nr:ATP-binding cassette domain-containing protein [Actinomyces capricornis]